MKRLKEQKAITLVALVITIIVLLILAGVALSLVVGETGIAQRAVNAGKVHNISGAKEKFELEVANLASEFYQAKYVNASIGANETVGSYVLSKYTEGTDIPFEDDYKLKRQGNEITLTSTIDGTHETATIDENGKVIWNGLSTTPVVSWTQDGNNITNGTKTLQIGDYVAYDPTDGATTTSVTSYGTDNGYGDQVFNVATYKTKGYGWRVFGVENGKILLIADEMIGPDSGGYLNSTYNTTYYYLQGRTGYQNGVSELDKIGALYGQGKYATGGRSINVTDVNRITGYNPDSSPKYGADQVYEYGNEVTYSWQGSGTVASTSTNGKGGSGSGYSNFYWFNTSAGNWVTSPSAASGTIAKLTSTYYYYSIPDKLGSDNSLKKSLLLGEHPGNSPYGGGGNYYFTNTGAERRYWLGSQYVDCDSSDVYFGLRFVDADGDVYGNGLASSYGYEFYRFFGVLPVVSLQSGVQLEYNTTAEEWQFAE